MNIRNIIVITPYCPFISWQEPQRRLDSLNCKFKAVSRFVPIVHAHLFLTITTDTIIMTATVTSPHPPITYHQSEIRRSRLFILIHRIISSSLLWCRPSMHPYVNAHDCCIPLQVKTRDCVVQCNTKNKMVYNFSDCGAITINNIDPTFWELKKRKAQ